MKGGEYVRIHYHASIEDILLYGISAIIVIDLLGLAAVHLRTRSGPIGTFGNALGAIVPFKG